MHHCPIAKGTLTTAEAARVLGVSSATLKRWAQAGLLESMRTAGGHRRFRAESVRALLPASPTVDEASRTADALCEGETVNEAKAWLARERRRHGSWWDVTRQVRGLVVELLRRKEAGLLSMIQVETTLDRVRSAALVFADTLSVPPGAPALLMAALPGDPLLLASALVQLCAPESGWRVRWAGHASAADVAEEAARGPVQAVVVSCSVFSSTEETERHLSRLACWSARAGVPVCAVGAREWRGRAWPVDVLASIFALREWLGRVVGALPVHEQQEAADPLAGAAPLAWSPALELGHPDVDAYHQWILLQIGLLARSVASGNSVTSGANLLGFISDASQEHFRIEEEWMRSIGYPELESHRSEHARFTRELAELLEEHRTAGGAASALARISDFLCAWMHRHLGDADQRIGLYLRQRGGEPSGRGP